MGKPIIIGMGFLWGLNKQKPVLPPGYYYVEEYREWTFAEWGSRRYYVSTEGNGVLYRQIRLPAGRCKECGKPKVVYHVNTDQAIVLPQKQLT